MSVVSMVRAGEEYGSPKAFVVVGDWYKLSDGSFVSADYVTLSAPLDGEEEELPPDDDDELPRMTRKRSILRMLTAMATATSP